jgi:catechol 2,3-dioxygenase-like lactoylglutathione lyase family enzyme
MELRIEVRGGSAEVLAAVSGEEDVGMQFDHLMHWVPDLDAAMRDYQGLGFTIQPGGEHPGVGTRNAAWRIDARYIELITVHDEGVARAGFGPAWPAIDATLRAGGGALGFAILVSDVAATVAELRSRGIGVEDAQTGSVQQPDGSTVTWALAFLSEGPAWAPFLINYGDPVDEWSTRFRGPGFPIDPWSLDHVVLEASDPVGNASWLAGVLGLPLSQVGQGAVAVALAGCTIAFARGPADRITRVVLAGADAPVGEVAGLRYQA